MAETFAHKIHIREIRSSGLDVRIQPTEQQRADLAKQLEIEAIGIIDAEFLLMPAKGGPDREPGYRVTGRIVGAVEQACVVTGDPVECQIEETIDILFLMPAEPERQSVAARNLSTTFLPEDDDIERIADDRIDLGALTAEFLAIGLDPYPRSAALGAGDHLESDDAQESADSGKPSPFDALEGFVADTKDGQG